ncbi:MAG: carboxypeptidase-like regulatory domain-containing protein [Planctomycetota bacterium]|nr:carboxypeptidase-like regulatory domain-containing protein [Planctomycetota bacterium]
MKMCLTLSLVLLASIATAAEQSRPAVSDVALQENGVLRGQVLTATGTPQAKTQVVLFKSGKVIAATMTDAKGEFAVAGVAPGLYQLESPHAGGVYRVWAQRTAPPAAKSGVLMIGDSSVVRAKGDDGKGDDGKGDDGKGAGGKGAGGKGAGGAVYGPAIRGAVAGGLLTGGLIAILDNNPAGS